MSREEMLELLCACGLIVLVGLAGAFWMEHEAAQTGGRCCVELAACRGGR